ncbi:MAG: Na+/H+ antiporter NhaA [Campylobacteraceae bacterium]|jgi:NhaA family Na+:H+ antiporter|nr:Na+/H+ antiporter NhaA [Campylobacteraceae bacterium]
MKRRLQTTSARALNLIKEFIHLESFGGILLLFTTIFALIAANIEGVSEIYHRFWQSSFGVIFGKFSASLTMHEWVNDVLMAVFFLSIGLEIKKEMLIGNLASVKKAAFPIIAAFGGMIVPICIYFGFNFGGEYVHGFGIPMATDIAFALGVLMLLGKRVPLELKIFLVTLAVVDDLGAIVVIALFYSGGIVWSYFFAAGGALFLLFCLNRFGMKNIFVYLIVGIFLWYFVHHSGIHATISGVLLAFTVPLRVENMMRSPLIRAEHTLNPMSAYFIMPIFAFANAGVTIGGEFALNDITLGIMTGLIIGKPIGIFLFTFLSEKFGAAKKPDSLSWLHILGAGFLGGIGFTMSIFIATLTFGGALLEEAKLTIMISSLIATIIGALFFRLVLFKITAVKS